MYSFVLHIHNHANWMFLFLSILLQFCWVLVSPWCYFSLWWTVLSVIFIASNFFLAYCLFLILQSIQFHVRLFHSLLQNLVLLSYFLTSLFYNFCLGTFYLSVSLMLVWSIYQLFFFKHTCLSHSRIFIFFYSAVYKKKYSTILPSFCHPSLSGHSFSWITLKFSLISIISYNL